MEAVPLHKTDRPHWDGQYITYDLNEIERRIQDMERYHPDNVTDEHRARIDGLVCRLHALRDGEKE